MKLLDSESVLQHCPANVLILRCLGWWQDSQCFLSTVEGLESCFTACAVHDNNKALYSLHVLGLQAELLGLLFTATSVSVSSGVHCQADQASFYHILRSVKLCHNLWLHEKLANQGISKVPAGKTECESEYHVLSCHCQDKPTTQTKWCKPVYGQNDNITVNCAHQCSLMALCGWLHGRDGAVS